MDCGTMNTSERCEGRPAAAPGRTTVPATVGHSPDRTRTRLVLPTALRPVTIRPWAFCTSKETALAKESPPGLTMSTPSNAMRISASSRFSLAVSFFGAVSFWSAMTSSRTSCSSPMRCTLPAML